MKINSATSTILKFRIPRPFLKWAGGKTQLLRELLSTMPRYAGKYLEPFVGGGALFFELKPKRAHLSDLNQELIDCYTAVRDQVGEVIAVLKTHRYDKEYFYDVRGWDPQALDPASRAARTIYLNKAGFNGLYRVNSRGGFNVPFGRYTNPMICDSENLIGCSEALKGVTLKCASFEKVLDIAVKGDFVYFDPPYIPLSSTSFFTAYDKSGFAMDRQQQLADVFHELASRGVFVMLSNADVPWIHDAYQGHRIRGVKATRRINSDAGKRSEVGEVIVTSY